MTFLAVFLWSVCVWLILIMAAKKKTEGATGTVQTRRANEAARQASASELRALEVQNTKAAHKATAKRLADKPTDTRTTATPDPTAGIL